MQTKIAYDVPLCRLYAACMMEGIVYNSNFTMDDCNKHVDNGPRIRTGPAGPSIFTACLPLSCTRSPYYQYSARIQGHEEHCIPCLSLFLFTRLVTHVAWSVSYCLVSMVALVLSCRIPSNGRANEGFLIICLVWPQGIFDGPARFILPFFGFDMLRSKLSSSNWYSYLCEYLVEICCIYTARSYSEYL